MLQALRALSARTELIVIVGGVFLPFIAHALASLAWPARGPVFTHDHLVALILREACLFAVFGGFLAARGWTPGRLDLGRPRARDLLEAIGLVLALWVVDLWLWRLLVASLPGPAGAIVRAQHAMMAPRLGTGTVWILSAVNGLFEEVFLCGCLIGVLRRRHGDWASVNASVAIRLSYHLSQGAAGVFVAVPVGLLFGVWYLRFGRLWPLALAHALLDLKALLPYA